MIRKALYLVFVLTLLTGSVVYAESPEAANGLAYLASSQNSDGSWGNDTSSTDILPATVSAIETLRIWSRASAANYTLAVSWLNAQKVDTTDYLAQRIRALSAAGADRDMLLSYVEQASYAWGGYDDYGVNNLDTALALQSLKAINHADSTLINNALNYLISTQNTDGGWGFSQGDDSNVYMTSMVSITLQQFTSTTELSASINKATGYLISHQNTDGGFGASSAVYETAYAYIGLIGSINDNTVLKNAISYIKSNQATNGSWNNDPYTTALALRALYLYESAQPTTGAVTGNVIDAATSQPLSGVTVALESDSNINMVTDAAGAFTLANVPQGSQRVIFTLAGYAQATADITVTAGSVFSLGNVLLTSNPTTGTIQGVATDESTGQPLSGVLISVTGAYTGTATTGTDGAFMFTNVTPGSVTMSAALTGYNTVSNTDVVVAGSGLFFNPKLKLITKGSLGGKVYDSVTNQPIQGASIAITGGAVAYTDAQGAFSIADIEPNTYQVTISAVGYQSLSSQRVISAGTLTDMGVVLLAPVASTTTVTGRITDALTGQPIGSATVSIKETALTTQTSADGSYTLTGINLLQFQVSATASGYNGQTMPVTTKSYGNVTVNMSLSVSSEPSMQLTLSKIITPDSVTPDGDKTINMGIKVKGLGIKPTVLYAIINQAGDIVTIAFDRPMADPSGKQAQFGLTSDSANWVVTAAALNSSDLSKIDLTLQQPITGINIILLSYTAGDVMSAAGESLPSFSNVLVSNSSSSSAKAFDAAADFSATQNPNGAWSYGWSTTLSGSMILYPRATLFYGYPIIDAWDDPSISSLGEPTVNHNRTGNSYAAGTVVWQPYQLTAHPGPKGEYSHVRWTAPTSGNITISAEFIGVDVVGTTTDVHVVHNDVSLFTDSIKGYGNKKSFLNNISVVAGDIIDFAVGYGSNVDFHYDTTGLSATVTYETKSVGSVRVIDTIPNAGIVIDQSSFNKTPYSITADADNTVVEWRYDTFSIGQVENLSFNATMTNPVAGERRLVNRKLEVIYNDSNGNTGGTQLGAYYVNVKESAFQSALAVDKTAYDVNSDVIISGSVKNIGDHTRTIDARVLIEYANGVLVQEVAAIPGLSFAAGEEKALGNLIFNTGVTYAGQYRAHLVLYDQQQQVGEAVASFAIQSTKTLTSAVTTDKAKYDAGEQAAITGQVQNTSPNYIFNKLTARISVLNIQNQVLNTEDSAISTLAPNQTIELKTYWNTALNPKGTYSVKLEILDGATVISSSTAAFEILGSGDTGAGLSGGITAQPNPVYHGNEETLTYTVTNKGNEDLTGIAIKALVVDPDTQTVEQTFTNQVDIQKGASVSGNFTVATTNLSAKTYVVNLQAVLPGTAGVKTLASAAFEVKFALEITKTVGNVANLLVWINDGCNKSHKVVGIRSLQSKVEGQDVTCEPEKKCVKEELFKKIFAEAGISYYIVYDKKEFRQELRNPVYTDMLILGEKSPLEDHYSMELREQVFGGKGLISSLYMKHVGSDYETLFGLRYAGHLSGNRHTVRLLKSPISEARTMEATGAAVSVMASDTNNVAAWLEEPHKKLSKECSPNKQPAILLNSYGSGKAVFYAFDLGRTLNAQNYEQVSELIRNSLTYVHRQEDNSDGYAPYRFVPIALTITSRGGAYDLRVTETYPSDIRIYDILGGKWITDNPWIWNDNIESGGIITRQYYAYTPDKAGVYTLDSEIAYKEGSNYVIYKNMPIELRVEKDTKAICGDIISDLGALKTSRSDSNKIRATIREITEVRNRVVKTGHDAEKNIHDMLEAIESVSSVTGSDVSRIRHKMDRLLESCEADWYMSQK